MENYIENSMHTTELEQSLSQSKVLPMVKDLSYKYDLRVSQRLIIPRLKYDMGWHRSFVAVENYDRFNDVNYNPKNDKEFTEKKQRNEEDNGNTKYEEAFLMNYKGIPQAVVYVDHENRFCFQVSYDIKDRGSDNWDRHTISSKKVSQVLKTLRRKKWQPLGNRSAYEGLKLDTKDMVMDYAVEDKTLSKAISDYDTAKSDLTYSNKDKLAEVLESLYGNKKAICHATSEHFKNEMKTLDDKRDTIQSTYKEVRSELDNEFTAIGMSNSGGWIVGNVKEHEGGFKLENGDTIHWNREDSHLDMFDIKFSDLIIYNTQMVRNLEQLDFFDSLKPTLTMLKVKLENWENENEEHKVVRNYFRNNSSRYGKSNWVEDLGCYYQNNEIYGATNNPFSIRWLLMAKTK